MLSTIKDVARVAGVSFKTVSRVINGGHNVTPMLRERVEEAIRQLDYRPTLAARQLASHRSFVINLVIPRLAASYTGRLIVAIADECRQSGYHLVTEVYDPQAEGQRPMFSIRSDAVILIPPFSDDPVLLDRLEEAKATVIRVASKGEGYGQCVAIDDTEIAARLVHHLLELGHRRIGMIAPPSPQRPADTRTMGYRMALREAGVEVDERLVVRGDMTFGGGVQAAMRLLAMPERPTAIFGATDYMALGAMSVANQLGYRVPDDVAIAGFDNAPESQMVFPPLTTVHQSVEHIAQVAIGLALSGEALQHSAGKVLLCRGSTTGDQEICVQRDQL